MLLKNNCLISVYYPLWLKEMQFYRNEINSNEIVIQIKIIQQLENMFSFTFMVFFRFIRKKDFED